MTLTRFRSLAVLLTTSLLFTCVASITARAQELLPAVELLTRDWTGEFWPGDFDGDGDTDLAVRAESRVAIVPGTGDGSFGPTIVSDTEGWPLAVTDLNGDGERDVIAQTESALVVLPGNGDGTLGSPRTILAGTAEFAIPAEMNGDAAPDLVVGEQGDLLHVVAGNGDFTFRPAVTMTTGNWPHGGTVADLNGDGLRDVAVAHRGDRRLVLFMNEGGLLFTRVDIPVEHSSTDVTARDLDGDGDQDLAASVRAAFDTGGGDLDGPWDFGAVYVYRGNGDGTFAAPQQFPTAAGSSSVVVGDFTHDGMLDLATSNSFQYALDASCGPSLGPESVSILPGQSDGTFGPSTTFVLDNEVVLGVKSLNTADLDGDAFPDLLVGYGDIFLTEAPRANRAPVVSAGSDLLVSDDFEDVTLHGAGSDPDGHLLTYSWDDAAASGEFTTQTPETCYSPQGDGTFRLTLTAQDGHGGVGSDSINLSVVSGAGIASGDDVGAVGAKGTFTYDGTTYTVDGSGADIWGTADEFYFVDLTQATGDFDLTAHVTGVQNANRWTKAGLMIRATSEPGSSHASVFATPTTEKGLAFQRRRTVGGTSVHTAGPALAPPVWLRLSRRADAITAWYRESASDTWTQIGSDSMELPESVHVGLAVSSHVDGTLARATFEEVALGSDGGEPGGLPEGWSNRDIGAVGAAGSATHSAGTFTVEGSGADIWGTADEFHFVSRSVTPVEQLVEVTARVTSVANVNRWTKVGIMVRDHLGASSPHAMLVVTPTTEKGVAFQYRSDEGGQSVHTGGPSLTAPIWLKLVSGGNNVRAYFRKAATDPWTLVGEQRRISGPATMEVGLVVSSHVDGTLATATFDNVSINLQQFDLDSRDIGAVGMPGVVRQPDQLTFSIEASGADIWGTADAFHFVSDSAIDSSRISERGRITARVRSVENTHRWAKAGVMIRESYEPDSPHVMVVVTPGMGIAMQYRTAAGGTSSSFASLAGAAPAWVRLTRDGPTFVGEASLDGVTWQLIGRVEVQMTPREQFGATLAGLAVTSHDNSTLATALFDDVRWEPSR